MFREILHFFKKQGRLTKAISIGVILIFFALYSLIGIIYKNYNINKEIRGLNDEIARLQADSIEQESKMLYYETDAYVERTLREKLGYQKDGERVYALPRQDPEREKLIKEQQAYQAKEDNKPNIIRWYEFFFIKDKQISQNNGETKPDTTKNPAVNTKP